MKVSASVLSRGFGIQYGWKTGGKRGFDRGRQA